ncbi:AEC family transporter [Limisalsivibrio acetivorans]|uniref:AEC family transporter n=1 Tax=Limisalsivibrio acetivorans TaxID=1304888 RepID=UPI0003B478E0|nr:AEC family transporter [Limisalsivibrio acetivorans]
MGNIILLVVCFLAGMIMRRSGRFPSGSATVLNQFIINISLPALALLHIHELKIDLSLAFPITMAWIVFLVSVVFFLIVGKAMGLGRQSIGCLMLSGGFGNTSFVGIPMINAYYGASLVGIGVLADQAGSFLCLSTLGIFTAAKFSSGKLSFAQVLKKVAMFPPFQALVVAVLLKPVEYPEWLIITLSELGSTITPLALVSVGFQLHLGYMKGALGKLGVGLLYKLAVAPVVIYILFVWLMGGTGEIVQVTVFEAAMGPMVTSSIVAMDYDLDPPLATLMLGIGIPLSFITLPVWFYLLGGV